MPGSTTTKSAARTAASTAKQSKRAKRVPRSQGSAPAPAPSPASVAARAPIPPAPRQRFVPSRVIEKNPPRHGEKPYVQLVADAFEGPVLRLSQKMKLLEEADNRKIRRGDALDLIAATQRKLEAKHRQIRKPVSPLAIFAKQYAVFVACYVAFALIWCGVMSLSSAAGANRADAARTSGMVSR